MEAHSDPHAMKLQPPNKTWENVSGVHQARFLEAVKKLGFDAIHFVAVGSDLYESQGLGQCFTPGLRYVKGAFWVCPSKVTIEDFAHDVGHVFLIPPDQKPSFDQPESDVETHEAGSMVIQWALLRAMDPAYPVGRSLEAFGYGFAGHDFLEDGPGEKWQTRLEQGIVVKAEVPACFALAQRGLAPPPALFYHSGKEDAYEEDWLWHHFQPQIALLPITQHVGSVLSEEPPVQDVEPSVRRARRLSR